MYPVYSATAQAQGERMAQTYMDYALAAEKVQVSSVQKVWKLLKAILAEASRAA